MEIEVLLERLLRWLDLWLNSPDNVVMLEKALTALDQWLQVNLGETPVVPGQPSASSSPAPGAAPAATQPVDPGQPASWIPPKLRRKQSSTAGMV